MKKPALIPLTILLALATPSIWGQNKPATPEEESNMLGRLGGAIEDVGAGEYRTIDQRYIREALRKLSGINKEIEKRQYSVRLRWLAHHWYGRAILDSGDPKRALLLFETAEKEANSLTISCSTSNSCISD